MIKDKKINLVAADMGYGHQRAAYPLLSLGGEEIITMNNYPDIPAWEKKYWTKSLESYERISRLKKVPLFGRLVFGVMDSFQKIKPFYPFRDLSANTLQQKFYEKSLKAGLGKDLIEKLSPGRLPFVTTFFVAAYAAEYFSYPGDIYCIVCDADVSRAWAPLSPENSRIKYLLPHENLRERFLMYGVKKENLIVTGFPLPLENIGDKSEIAERDLARRLRVLDPNGQQAEYYDFIQEKYPEVFSKNSQQPLVITFAVGGAGAQKEIGADLIIKLGPEIKKGKYRLNLVAGNRLEVKEYFEHRISAEGFLPGEGIEVVYAPNKLDYFRAFNDCLHQTDILWTKPSELSFYCALGLPIIISSPVGSQEDFNRAWLLGLGAGIDSLDTEYAPEWLDDLWKSGQLARAAVDGWLNAEKRGAYNIKLLFIGK
jgi:hypothetical protein